MIFSITIQDYIIQPFLETNQGISELGIKGRHDACFAIRVPVIIEAVTACVLADLLMIEKSKK